MDSAENTSDIFRDSVSINSVDTLSVSDFEELLKSDEFATISVGFTIEFLDIVEIVSSVNIISEDVSNSLSWVIRVSGGFQKFLETKTTEIVTVAS